MGIVSGDNKLLMFSNISSSCDQLFGLKGKIVATHLEADYKTKVGVRNDCFSGMFYRFLVLPYLEQLGKGLGRFESDKDINSRLFTAKSQLAYIKNIMKVEDFAEVGSPIRDSYAIQFMLESIVQGRHIRIEQQDGQKETSEQFARVRRHFSILELQLIVITVGAWCFYVFLICKCCCGCGRPASGKPSPMATCCGKSMFRCIASLPDETLGRIREETELSKPLRTRP